MKLDTTRFIGYGIDLNLIQTIIMQTGMNQPAYKKSLDNILHKHSYTDYVEDFNNEIVESHLPEVSCLTDQDVIYFDNNALTHFKNLHNVIPLLIDCIAQILWSEYSAQFDDSNYPIDEDTFFKTVKQSLSGRQRTLFGCVKVR